MKLTEEQQARLDKLRQPSDAAELAMKFDLSERQVRRILDGECADSYGIIEELIKIVKRREKRKEKLAVEIELLAAKSNQQRIELLKRLVTIIKNDGIDINQYLQLN